MDSWRWLCLVLLCATFTGCRTARLTEPLERENRHLEDHLYELQDQLREMECQLDSCRHENAALRRQSPVATGASRDDDFERRTTSPSLAAPTTELGAPTSGMPNSNAPSSAPRLDDAPPFRAPEISPPNPAIPDGKLPNEAPPFTPTPASPQSSILPDGAGPALERVKQSVSNIAELVGKRPEEPITDYDVTAITLNPRLTGGHDRNSTPGDEGIMVVIEPRNQAKQIVPVAAEISIVVLDPTKEGPAARVARWDFTADEAAEHFTKTAFGNGLEFDLPWPATPPQQRALSLFVRYTLPNKQVLIVDKPINVRLVGDTAEKAGEATPPAQEASTNPEDRTAGREQWQESAQRQQPRRIRSDYQGEEVPRQARRSVETSAPNQRRRPPQWAPGR